METTTNNTNSAAKTISLKSIANSELKSSVFSLSKLCKLCANDEHGIISKYIAEKYPNSTFKASQITTKLVGKLAKYNELNKVTKEGAFIAKKELFSFWFILSIVDRHIKASK